LQFMTMFQTPSILGIMLKLRIFFNFQLTFLGLIFFA